MNLSIVVPTLNEARHIAQAIASLPAEAEILVADGGSVDETVSVATHDGARVVSGSMGRAKQMNRGAKAAGGDVLLFLHADCTLGATARAQIEAALEDPGVVGGSFRLDIRGAGPGLKLIAATSNARARYLATPYGDQALFVRRSAFEQIGGFPELPFMEDVALVRRLKKLGRLVRVDETVTTGPRHWEKMGPLGTTLLNWTMVTLFLLGVPPEKLHPYYCRFRNAGTASKSENALNPS